jgi:uncharacterized membrane protein YkoI
MIKNITAVYLIGLSVMLFIVLPCDNSVIAQQQNNTNSSQHNNSTGNNKTVTMSHTLDRQQQQNPHSMSMDSLLQNQDWTGSTSLFNPILDAIKSKIHTTLNDATTDAINAIGGAGSNSTALAAFIHPENGSLVYDVLVLDSSNNIHRVIVDSRNGKVISNLPLSMTDMKSVVYPFTEMKMEGPSLADFQLNLSDNIFVFNQNISICGSFICQAHLEYNIPRR